MAKLGPGALLVKILKREVSLIANIEKRLAAERARYQQRVWFGCKPKVEINYQTFLEYRSKILTLKGIERYQFYGFAINNYRLTKFFNCYVKLLRDAVYYMHRVGSIRSSVAFRYSFVSHCNQGELPILDLY